MTEDRGLNCCLANATFVWTRLYSTSIFHYFGMSERPHAPCLGWDERVSVGVPYKYNQKWPGPMQFWRRLSWVFSQEGSCQAAYTNGGRADLESILCFRQIFCSYLAKAKQHTCRQSNICWSPSVNYWVGQSTIYSPSNIWLTCRSNILLVHLQSAQTRLTCLLSCSSSQQEVADKVPLKRGPSEFKDFIPKVHPSWLVK